MIDSHCHLDHDPLYTNLNDVIKRSKDAGVKKILTICTTSDSFKNILEIVKKDEMIYGTFGIHPHETNKELITKDTILVNLNKDTKIIGIGETGLDFFYNNSEKKIQIKSFEEHIEAAIKSNYPLIIHSRSAENETFDILNNYKNYNLKILMHCFTGSENFSKKLQSLNAYFSASGIITFKNSLDLQETFKSIPMENILIETDSQGLDHLLQLSVFLR